MHTSVPAPVHLSHLLPSRGIVVRSPRTVEGGTSGVVALLAAVLLGMVAWLGPDVVSDWRLRGDAVPAPDLTVREAQCRSWLGFMRFCSVRLTAAGEAAEGGRRIRYAFFGTGGNQPAAAVRSAIDPSHIATDLGVATVYSRLAALGILAGVLLFCIGAVTTVWRRGAAARRMFAGLSGQALTPVVVEIERHNRLPPRRRLWVYLYEENGKRERALAEWPSSRHPLFTTLDEKNALALRGAGGGAPMLLDAKLESLDLTAAEKEAFYRAFRAAFAPETPAPATILP